MTLLLSQTVKMEMRAVVVMYDSLEYILSTQFLSVILIAIGVYASLWWIIDNLKSITQIFLALLRPFFQPQDDLPLKERFGTWAGKHIQTLI